MFGKIIHISLILFIVAAESVRIWPYYASWAKYRSSPYNMKIMDIPGRLITHLSYAFLEPLSNGTIRIDTEIIEDFMELQRFKIKFPTVKVVVSIGGGNNYSLAFNDICSSEQLMRRFADNIGELLIKYNLDGVDLDWEYPSADQKNDFVSLLKAISISIKTQNKSSILSIATPASSYYLEQGYDLNEVNKYVDIFNVMTYDFHGPWNDEVGHNSPMYSPDKNDLVTGLGNYLVRGIDPKKINIGLPFYGRSFKLANSTTPEVGSSVDKNSTCYSGPFTKEPGYLAYFEIVALKEWESKWDDYGKAPFIYKNRDWISYDSYRSLGRKILYGCLEKNIGGFMIWDISMDTVQFDLLKSVKGSTNNFCINKNSEYS